MCKVSLHKKPRAEKVFSGGTVFCRTCYSSSFSHSKSLPQQEVKVTLDIKCASRNQNSCIFCDSVHGRCRIPKHLRVLALINYRIFIYADSRSCEYHMKENDFDEASVAALRVKKLKFTQMTGEEISQLIDDLREHSASAELIEDESNKKFFSETEDVHVWTGLKKDQFLQLAECIQRESEDERCLILGIYLMSLYGGLSQRQIAAFLTISQATVSRYMHVCREFLNALFVSVNLDSIDRKKVIAETTEIARVLHGVSKDEDKLITVWDGTYLYLNKSENFSFQRATYSGHKKKNYVKPMMCVTTNGFIVNVLGPDKFWAGKVSDADILKVIMETDWFKSFFKEGDIFVLDRGFENIRSALESRGFVVSIPVSKQGASQLSTQEANISRFCTKLRWVVEWSNSSVKRFAQFKNPVLSCEVPHLYKDFRIASAIHNRFFKRQFSDSDNPEIARSMLKAKDSPNVVQKIVEDGKWIRKQVIFEVLTDDHFQQLPKWTSDDLKCISGSYQIGLAKSYMADHLNDGKYQFQITKDASMPDFAKYQLFIVSPFFVKARLLSRHFSNKIYHIFILVDLSQASYKAISGSYCTCKNGARTVNPCAHVVALIWYMFYGRHNKENYPSSFLNDSFPLLKTSFPGLSSEDESGGSDNEDDFG